MVIILFVSLYSAIAAACFWIFDTSKSVDAHDPAGVASTLSHALIAIVLLFLFCFLSGCQLTAHVASRPVIDGTPVSIGVEVGQ